MPWIVLGVLVVAGCALIAAVWAGRVAQRTPVLALARAVEAGQPLAPEDLRAVDLAIDGSLPFVPAAQASEVVGRSLSARLPAGTLLAPDLLTTGAGLAPGARVVGLALDPGEFPVSDLRPGDAVAVVRTPVADGATADPGPGTVLLPSAAVHAVAPLDETSPGLLVSVVVGEADVGAVLGAAALDRVRLALAGTP